MELPSVQFREDFPKRVCVTLANPNFLQGANDVVDSVLSIAEEHR
jgi:hypothetical protein